MSGQAEHRRLRVRAKLEDTTKDKPNTIAASAASPNTAQKSVGLLATPGNTPTPPDPDAKQPQFEQNVLPTPNG